MGGISSSIGLISGIDTQTLIGQLIAIESRPKIFAQTRLTTLKSEQGAFLGFNSLLLTLKSASEAFRVKKLFQSTQANSSNASVLTATASTNALPGSYQFLVDQLVSSNQMITQGFADAGETELGGTEISFEFGNGRIKSETSLAALNGGAGVSRGKIKITDSDGESSVIDLSKAVTVNDVLDAINLDGTIDVTASLTTDGFKLVDNAGGAGNLIVDDEPGYSTATDLGIKGDDSGTGTLTGTQVNSIVGTTALQSLNDNNGVLIPPNALDGVSFTINTAAGDTFDILLGKTSDYGERVTTLQGVIDRIEEVVVAEGIGDGSEIDIALSADGLSLEVVDNTAGGNTFEIVGADATQNQTIADLGLNVASAGGTISGTRLISSMNSVMLRSLNGGSGVTTSTVTITDRSGASSAIDVSSALSMDEIISLINADGTVDVTAAFNDNGTGLKITDNTGLTTNNLIILTDDGGDELGIDTGVTGVAEDSYAGANVQMQYVSRSTRIDDLNYGRGIGNGSFQITDGEGDVATIDFDSDDYESLDEFISYINSRGLEITAGINSTGDGLLITNTAGSPTAAIKIESVSGSTAKDLNIIGEGEDPITNNFIDGSYERKVELDPTDTLNDIISKINAEGIPIAATLINDGGPNPFRLSLASEISGLDGDMIIGMEGFDLGLSTLNEAQDSVVFFGSDDPARSILITSSTNSLDNLIGGVNIDLKGASDSVVNLTISRDNEQIVAGVKEMVDAFNAVIERINAVDSFDADTEQRGVLLGNATVARIRSQLYRTIQGKAQDLTTQHELMVEVGIRIGAGGKLELDEETLRTKMAEDPAAVEALFAERELEEDQTIDLGNGITVESEDPIFKSLGVGEQLVAMLEGLTNSIDGTLKLVNENYDRLITVQVKRLEAFDVQLANRRIQLERQFAAMESALASLQGQQAALSTFVSI